MVRTKREPNSAYRQRFGQRVQQKRKAAGLSQEGLAHAAGISRRYMSGIERGEANPTVDQIVRLADAIGVAPATLMPPTT